MYSSVRTAVQNSVRDGFATEIPQEDVLVRRPKPDHGDLAVECFSLAKRLGVPPVALAQHLSSATFVDVSSVEVKGPYVNIRMSDDPLFRAAIEHPAVIHPVPKSERIMVEYLSPNTNKPLHLGHVRNGVLGSAIANILQAAGHTVIRANLVNDRGIHICKSMLGYELFGKGDPATEGLKPDHFVGKCYVQFEQAKAAEQKLMPEMNERDLPLMQKAQEYLRLWENADPHVREVWKRMNGWFYRGFSETTNRYNFRFETEYLESETYLLGKSIAEEGLRAGTFITDEKGAIIYPLPAEFGTDANGKRRVVEILRADGTSSYFTQDLGTAVKKVDDFEIDRSVYVVACEQDDHFRRLFAVLTALGFGFAKKCYHLSYEMVELPSGRMKSREGTVVDADTLADEVAELALSEIRKRQNGERSDDRERAELIGLAAIKFYLLSYSPRTKIRFDPKTSISFEGDTGPYCLYTYARIKSILRKAREEGLAWKDLDSFSTLGNEEERTLALDILSYSEEVAHAAAAYNPSPLVNYLLALSGNFNRFYRTHPVLQADEKTLRVERLALIEAVGITLRKGLSLLGIDVLEYM